MNIEVDNEILASLIDARFGIKPQLSSNIEKANFKQTIFFPEDKLKSNTFNSVPLDTCLLYTSPSPRDLDLSRMPSSA